MVEARFIDPYVHPFLHQLMHVIEHAVGRESDITVLGHHDLGLHPSFHCFLQGFLQFVVQGEVGVHQLNTVVSVVDGIDVELTDNGPGDMGFTVDDTHHLLS